MICQVLPSLDISYWEVDLKGELTCRMPKPKPWPEVLYLTVLCWAPGSCFCLLCCSRATRPEFGLLLHSWHAATFLPLQNPAQEQLSVLLLSSGLHLIFCWCLSSSPTPHGCSLAPLNSSPCSVQTTPVALGPTGGEGGQLGSQGRPQ